MITVAITKIFNSIHQANKLVIFQQNFAMPTAAETSFHLWLGWSDKLVLIWTQRKGKK